MIKTHVLVFYKKSHQGSMLMKSPSTSCLVYLVDVLTMAEKKKNTDFLKKHSAAEALFIRFHTPQIT